MLQYSDILNNRREVWRSKEIVRRLYHKWYGIIGDAIKPGTILEIGGGSGNLKEFFPDVMSSDIIFVPWLDVVADAHHLPFQKENFDNIILFDVLHHLIDPASFFKQAQRALKQKGRIVLMEPYISWASFFIYRFLHPEGLIWNVDPFKKGYLEKNKNHLHGNQALPTLMFERNKHLFAKKFPGLNIIKIEKMDFIIYPLSGGFHHLDLCPLFLYQTLEHLEKLFNPLKSFLAFRLLVVLEKT